nr:hypothetical protein [Kibdelosporangium sp. MJ126-NF4]CTQ92001.1 hypothetical protein [Kibdelosporangium sp. MJ126-NF4]
MATATRARSGRTRRGSAAADTERVVARTRRTRTRLGRLRTRRNGATAAAATLLSGLLPRAWTRRLARLPLVAGVVAGVCPRGGWPLLLLRLLLLRRLLLRRLLLLLRRLLRLLLRTRPRPWLHAGALCLSLWRLSLWLDSGCLERRRRARGRRSGLLLCRLRGRRFVGRRGGRRGCRGSARRGRWGLLLGLGSRFRCRRAGPRARLGAAWLGALGVARLRVRIPQPARHRRLHGGGRRLHVLTEIGELREYFFTRDTELFCELVHAGLACHCSPHWGGRRQKYPLDLVLPSHVHGVGFTADS